MRRKKGMGSQVNTVVVSGKERVKERWSLLPQLFSLKHRIEHQHNWRGRRYVIVTREELSLLKWACVVLARVLCVYNLLQPRRHSFTLDIYKTWNFLYFGKWREEIERKAFQATHRPPASERESPRLKKTIFYYSASHTLTTNLRRLKREGPDYLDSREEARVRRRDEWRHPQVLRRWQLQMLDGVNIRFYTLKISGRPESLLNLCFKLRGEQSFRCVSDLEQINFHLFSFSTREKDGMGNCRNSGNSDTNREPHEPRGAEMRVKMWRRNE